MFVRTTKAPRTKKRPTASAARELSRSPGRVDRVYKYGCLPPRDPAEHALALQLLGQASNYREELRRAYNDDKRFRRAVFEAEREAEHVRAFEASSSQTDEVGHVFVFEKSSAREELAEMRNAAIRSARSRSGHLVDAGTYWLVEEAVLQAAKMSGLDPIAREPWEETGRIGAMIASKDAFLFEDGAACFSHKRASLEVLRTFRKNGHDVEDGRLTLRVGDLKDDRPISWPVSLCRRPPPGSIVKRVAVQRIRRGRRYAWEALVTLSMPAEVSYSLPRSLRKTGLRPAERDAGARGVVGINLGWRRESELIRYSPNRRERPVQRAATYDGGGGDRGVLLVDALESFEYANAVRSIRDRIFDDAKAYVRSAGLAGTEHAHLWRDKDRMQRLARREKVNPGPAWWSRVDGHLEDIESGVRGKAVRRRLEQYRAYADQLARRFRVVALEDMPMAAWVGKGETHAREARRSAVALHLLQDAVAHRFGPGRVDWVPAEGSSRTCADCGAVHPRSVGPAPEWTCTSCGVVHHQDENAAEVLRVRSERWIAAGNPPRARARKPPKTKGKLWAKGIATGDEQGMIVTARDPFANAAE